MSVNKPIAPADRVYAWSIRGAGGLTSIIGKTDEFEAYNRDPDGYAAAHFGISKANYVEWVEHEGMPLCGATTRAGNLCKQPVGPTNLPAQVWVSRHREVYCKTHGGEGSD